MNAQVFTFSPGLCENAVESFKKYRKYGIYRRQQQGADSPESIKMQREPRSNQYAANVSRRYASRGSQSEGYRRNR
jgi:hypothetical protein